MRHLHFPVVEKIFTDVDLVVSNMGCHLNPYGFRFLRPADPIRLLEKSNQGNFFHIKIVYQINNPPWITPLLIETILAEVRK